jgi:hypothetical protein
LVAGWKKGWGERYSLSKTYSRVRHTSSRQPYGIRVPRVHEVSSMAILHPIVCRKQNLVTL